MVILALDDEVYALQMLEDALHQAVEDAQIHAFNNTKIMLEFAEKNPCDVAFLDIEMGEKSGIEVAKELKAILPRINIVFVTAHDEYMGIAFDMHASGYVLKPARVDAIKNELNNLRNFVPQVKYEKELMILTFGNFEVFYDGVPLRFARSKSKELLAYLVDRKGASVTMAEIAAVLWEDKSYNRSVLNQIHSLLSDIMKKLKLIGKQDVIVKERNSVSINVELVKCDYFNFLKGDAAAINSFHNEYMTNYSWAEFTVAKLHHHND